MSNDPKNLTEYSRAQKNPPAQRPYRWDELSETARHNEILLIVRQAAASTQPYYAMGYYKRATEENWVAQWFLWHCFRYRDNRPRPAVVNSGHAYGGEGKLSLGTLRKDLSTRDLRCVGGPTQYFDPVYDRFRY